MTAAVISLSKKRVITLIISTGLFFASLGFEAFCTTEGCRSGIEVLSLGWLAALSGGAGIVWLANPLLIWSWLLINKSSAYAWIPAFFAILISLAFLSFPDIIENEGGRHNEIIRNGIGYWLWVCSSIASFTGAVLMRLSMTMPEDEA